MRRVRSSSACDGQRRGAVLAGNAARRGALYSIRAGESPVTNRAIRVTVASGARDRLGPVRHAHRRRAPAREPRGGGPRAAAAARRAQARQAPAPSSPHRPRLLGRRLSRLVEQPLRPRTRSRRLPWMGPALVAALGALSAAAWHAHAARSRFAPTPGASSLPAAPSSDTAAPEPSAAAASSAPTTMALPPFDALAAERALGATAKAVARCR